MVNPHMLADTLEQKGQQEGNLTFSINRLSGENNVLQIIIENREDLPVFLSISEEQILCIAYLFGIKEVKQEYIHEMNQAMLTANINIPLSSFAIVGSQYVLYGSLSVNSSINEIVYEVETLSNNTLESIEAMRDYLI